MSSSTVRAQKLANKANIQMSQETNQTNKDIASAANTFNKEMQEYQNQWNLDRRAEEWAYNDPSAQMERYMKAGINPIWALSGADAGTAQQLTSAEAKDAVIPNIVTPHVEPEYDPSRLTNIVAASRDLSNSLQGFQRLYLESEDVLTRRQAQQSQAALNSFEANYKSSLTAGQNLRNSFDTNTFGTRVNSMVANLHKMEADIGKTKQDTANAAALHENIVATKGLINAEIDNYNSQVKYRIDMIAALNRQNDIAQQNADTAAGQLQLGKDTLSFDKTKWQDQLKKWNNDEIFRWAQGFGSRTHVRGEGSIKVQGFGVEGEASLEERKPNTDALYAAGVQMFENCKNNPTKENIDAYESYNKWLLQQLKSSLQGRDQLPSSTIPISSTSILNENPDQNWQP